MISITLRLFLIFAFLAYFILIVIFLRKKSLSLKYSLLWIFAGFFMGVLLVFPNTLNVIVNIIDIKSPMNGLFAICIFFILIILMSLTSIVSKQSDKIKRLVQDNAFLEKRIREIENSDKSLGDK